MAQNFHVAIHEAGHAVAFLAHGCTVEWIMLDCDSVGGRVFPGVLPASEKSDAIITLAGIMAEQIALEKDVIDVPPQELPNFSRVPFEEKDDDESKYRSLVYRLQRSQPIWTRIGIDRELKRETRELIERYWNAVLEIAHALHAAPERPNHLARTMEKVLDGAIVERIFKLTTRTG